MLALDFVALTEDLATSLELVNAGLGISLQSRHHNKTPWRPFQVRANKLDEAARQSILERNQRDIELYAAVQERFRRDAQKLQEQNL